MTREETRKLGIEFERRLIEIYPQFASEQKLSTDAIYSFLSEFQTQYVKILYSTEDDFQRGTRRAKRISDVSRSLIRRVNIKTSNDEGLYKLPDNYAMYVRSESIVTKNYKSDKTLENGVITPNILVKQEDVDNVINTYYNYNGIIKNPLVVFENTSYTSNQFKVITDAYTQIESIDLTYYCQPNAFNVLKFNDKDQSAGAVHSYCSLPYSCFEELVSGAVDMYLTQYKLKLAQGNSKQSQPKQQETE